MSRAGREGTDRERIEEAHAVEHHLAWQNAQPGHALVAHETAEQNKKASLSRVPAENCRRMQIGVFVFSIFFFVKNDKKKQKN